MDIQDYFAAARDRDSSLQDMAVFHLVETSQTHASQKAVLWAVNNDIPLVDVFYDFHANRPGMAEIGVFINTALSREFGGDFCYARRQDGCPVISLKHPSEPHLHVTPDLSITNFDAFVQAREAYVATLTREDNALSL